MKNTLVFPRPLKYGDHIRIIAPSSPPKSWSKFNDRIEMLKALGFKVSLSKNIKKTNGYLAGTDEQRLKDLHDAFSDKSVNIILCLRGGYGAPRLLQKVNYSLIRKNPKLLCGFSDITALHFAIFTKSKVATIHGPNFNSLFKDDEFIDFTLKNFLATAMTSKSGNKKLFSLLPKKYTSNIKTINKGKMSGWLIGGNLSLISSLVGTEFFPSLKGACLFIEELNEPAYRLDRMFQQLILSGALKGVKSIIIGECISCPDYHKVLAEKIKPLKIPAIIDAPFGHIDEMVSFQFGRMI
jgi:muramoyltetrapeptide carboxypeptidase